MIKISIIRHAQASALSDNYDQLSELGERQAAALGKYLAESELMFDAIHCGTLQRQQSTANIMRDTAIELGKEYPKIKSHVAFNEIHFGEVFTNIRQYLFENNPDVRDLISQLDQETDQIKSKEIISKIISAVFRSYISGEYQSDLLQPWTIFRDNIRTELLTLLNQTKQGKHLALVTSGGPIIATCQLAFDISDQSTSEKQWGIYNCSITHFTYDQQRLTIESFNSIEHLEHDPELITRI